MNMMWLIFLSFLVSWVSSEKSGVAVDLSFSCVHLKDGKKDAAPIFLLHGMTLDRTSWSGIYQVLALQTGRTVCAADARNHGHSPQVEAFNYDLTSADQLRLMDRLNVSKAILLGHSMGGKTAAVTALLHPDRVEKLIVEDMKPNSPDPDSLVRANFTYQTVLQSLDAIPEGANREEAQEAVFQFIDKTMRETFGFGVPEKEKAIIQDLLEFADGRWRFKPELKLVLGVNDDPDMFCKVFEGIYDGDTLFVYGKNSVNLSEMADEIKKQFPKAQFVGIEGAGHGVHSDKPKEFLSAVIKFINEQ